MHLSRIQYLSARARESESGMHASRRTRGEEIGALAAVSLRKQLFRLGDRAAGGMKIVQPFKLGQIELRARKKLFRHRAAVTGHMKAHPVFFAQTKHRFIERCFPCRKFLLFHQSFLTGFIVGNKSTSLMLAWSVKNMTILSTPMPKPPVGGRPYMSALT